jgi:hypothetical protein
MKAIWIKPTKSKGIYSHVKQGKRADLGNIHWRSAREANYARFLNLLIANGKIKKWEFEVQEFKFPIERGIRFYLPDFRVTKNDDTIEFHEVKGYMNRESKVKLNRMAKYYPDVKVVLIGSKEYAEISRNFSKIIRNWE